MALYGRITVAGLGLIGGSLGLAARQRGLAERVVGLARRPETLEKALGMGAIDEGCLDPAEAARETELLVLAAPVRASIDLGRTMMPLLPAGSVVTDVCSTKGELLTALAEALPPQVSLIGGHPMAGREKAGIDYASPELFLGARYLLLPVEVRLPEDYGRLKALVAGLGAAAEEIGIEEHDALTALVSHLPHAVAQSLVSAVAELDSESVARMAAGGFRDITRVAGSDPRMWNDIYLSNHDQVLRAIELFRSRLDHLSALIRAGDEDALIAFLAGARDYRDGLGR